MNSGFSLTDLQPVNPNDNKKNQWKYRFRSILADVNYYFGMLKLQFAIFFNEIQFIQEPKFVLCFAISRKGLTLKILLSQKSGQPNTKI